MNNNENNSKDFKLAEKVGEVLDGDQTFSDLTDPLASDLLHFKAETKEELNSQLPPSTQIWKRVQADMDSAKSNSANIYHLTRTTFAAAAAILIVCFAGLFYYFSQPQLVGKSEAKIAKVSLADGSQVTLRPHSKIFKSGLWSTANFTYELSGEGFFDITQRETHEFSVKAGNGIVRVLGTRFTLSNWSGETEVYLEEGKVKIESEVNNEETILHPGESVSISEQRIEKFTLENTREYTDWMQQELIFNNRTAAYVFSELEQHYQITINAPDDVLTSRLTGQLALENVNQTLQDIEIVLNGTFTKTNDQIYNFQSN